ncbi:MAG: hypothetical protein EKK42_15075 [Pseudonocardiaceae bacterium]|nr:MAG: hypothetical protein EKK42_15075 [Pseudonocardiaceae bacterium]
MNAGLKRSCFLLSWLGIVYSAHAGAAPLDNTKQALLFKGKCTFAIKGQQSFTCKGVSFWLFDNGRANFTVAFDDPDDDGHVISFSGQSQPQISKKSYTLVVDRVLLNSQGRPKHNGLPVPQIKGATGICNQTGGSAAGSVQKIMCMASNKQANYMLFFESTNLPINILEKKDRQLADDRSTTSIVIDKDYISTFWKADAGGIFDVKRGAYVISAKRPDKLSPPDLIKSFATQNKVTAKDTSGLPLQYEVHYSHSGKEYFVATLETSNQGSVPFPIAISTPFISDKVGVRVGQYLTEIDGYNWKRLCVYGEGMLNCRSAYSENVIYDLGEGASMEGTENERQISLILSKNPIRQIQIYHP